MIENFGLYLKHERELRGVVLEEIAKTTKIHIRYLEALENNDFDKLPGEVFVKGFIRSYAKVIGFDAEELVNAYDESVGRERKEELEKVQIINKEKHSRKKATAGYVLGGIAMAAVILLGYFVVDKIIAENKKQRVELSPADNLTLSQQASPKNEIEANDGTLPDEELSAPNSANVTGKSETETPPEPMASIPETTQAEEKNQKVIDTVPEALVKTSEPAEVKKAEPKTPIESAVMEKSSALTEKPVIIQQVMEESASSVDPDQGMPDTDARALHLKIQVQGNSWFNVTVDDSKEEDFILPGGSTKNVYGSEKIRLTIGNRNGTRLFLNEQPIDLPPGSSDVIRNFEISANLLE